MSRPRREIEERIEAALNATNIDDAFDEFSKALRIVARELDEPAPARPLTAGSVSVDNADGRARAAQALAGELRGLVGSVGLSWSEKDLTDCAMRVVGAFLDQTWTPELAGELRRPRRGFSR